MKNALKKMLAAFLCLAMVISLITPSVKAAEEDEIEESVFRETFFPEGISQPETPFVYYKDRFDEEDLLPTEVKMWYFLPEEIQELLKAHDEAEANEEEFAELYDMDYDFYLELQVDVCFDDGEWFSEGGIWDEYDEEVNYYDDYLDYDEEDEDDDDFDDDDYDDDFDDDYEEYEGYDGEDYSLLLRDNLGNELIPYANKFTPCDLYFYDPDWTEIEFVQDYLMEIEDYEGNTIYQYDLENHTMSFRYRYMVTWSDSTASTFGMLYEISDWSEPFTIGGGIENEVPFKEPKKVPAPEVLDVALVEDEDEGLCIAFQLEGSKELYEGLLYYLCSDPEEGYADLTAQVRFNGGEWHDYWLSREYIAVPGVVDSSELANMAYAAELEIEDCESIEISFYYVINGQEFLAEKTEPIELVE